MLERGEDWHKIVFVFYTRNRWALGTFKKTLFSKSREGTKFIQIHQRISTKLELLKK